MEKHRQIERQRQLERERDGERERERNRKRDRDTEVDRDKHRETGIRGKRERFWTNFPVFNRGTGFYRNVPFS